jgi:hypothetical protein
VRDDIAPDTRLLNQRREPKDLGGSVTFDRSYRANIAAVMKHVTEVLSYIDTVELYIGGLWPSDDYFQSLHAEITRLQLVRQRIPNYEPPWFMPVRWQDKIIGWRYIVNVPTRGALPLLDEMVQFPHVWLHRVDPSYDFITDSAYRANAARLHFIRHLILRWCRSPYMPDVFGTTTYWGRYKLKHKRPQRNAVAYCDKAPKMRGAFGFHLDSRAITAPSVRRLGIAQPSGLLTFDPAKHFGETFILAGDYWDQIEKLTKEYAQLKHLTQNYRAQLLNKYCSEFELNRVDLDVLRLPSELTF